MNAWQKIIFLNYGVVKPELIASVIGTDAKTVTDNACLMGLSNIEFNPDWQKNGYVTVLRNNWHLLSKPKIAVLLEMSESELDTLMRDYDFLGEKLGTQYITEEAAYKPLSEEELAETRRLRKFTEDSFIVPSAKPFDFYRYPASEIKLPEKQDISSRFVSPYCAKYNGALLDDSLSDYGEEYLERLKKNGTNGIWIYENARNLSDFYFDSKYSPDYKIRIANLKKLTERCKKHGIDVYLYLNEPRSLPAEFFERYPDFKGEDTDDGEFCLCTSVKEVQEYIYNSVKSIAEGAPLLKGIMTITMSENATHCHSKKWKHGNVTCKNCKDRAAEEITAEINNIMAKALRDAGGRTRLIANLWGWSSFMNWNEEQLMHGIELLDKDIDVLCVSEYSTEFTRGGIKTEVVDYSISVVGPSDISKRSLEYARSLGHRIWAKIQINNSWECSAVPYLPTFGLMAQHIKNLKSIGVSGLMMSWSLGGYPGGAMQYCNAICVSDDFDEAAWYEATFAENAKTVKEADGIFCRAFKHYPFCVDGLYFGAHTLGVGNDIISNHGDKESSLVCFTYDDYEKYTEPYGIDVYTELYRKLTDEWKLGLEVLNGKNGNGEFESFKNVALGAYIHFKSALNSAMCAKYKRKNNTEGLTVCAVSQLELTKTMYELISRDARIGFEMTNHYYYNTNLLLLRMFELSNFICLQGKGDLI